MGNNQIHKGTDILFALYFAVISEMFTQVDGRDLLEDSWVDGALATLVLHCLHARDIREGARKCLGGTLQISNG